MFPSLRMLGELRSAGLQSLMAVCLLFTLEHGESLSPKRFIYSHFSIVGNTLVNQTPSLTSDPQAFAAFHEMFNINSWLFQTIGVNKSTFCSDRNQKEFFIQRSVFSIETPCALASACIMFSTKLSSRPFIFW